VRPAIISKLEAEALSLLICGDGGEKRLPYREAIDVTTCPFLSVGLIVLSARSGARLVFFTDCIQQLVRDCRVHRPKLVILGALPVAALIYLAGSPLADPDIV
jgi:hypothetical protein